MTGTIISNDGSRNDNDITIAQVTYDWSIGSGMICLFAGFGCKVIEFICNCCSVTPAITRDVQEQEEYEQWILSEENDNDYSNDDEKYSDDDEEDVSA